MASWELKSSFTRTQRPWKSLTCKAYSMMENSITMGRTGLNASYSQVIIAKCWSRACPDNQGGDLDQKFQPRFLQVNQTQMENIRWTKYYVKPRFMLKSTGSNIGEWIQIDFKRETENTINLTNATQRIRGKIRICTQRIGEMRDETNNNLRDQLKGM